MRRLISIQIWRGVGGTSTGLPCGRDTCISVFDTGVCGNRGSASCVCSWRTGHSSRCYDSPHTDRKGSTEREKKRGEVQGMAPTHVCTFIHNIHHPGLTWKLQPWSGCSSLACSPGCVAQILAAAIIPVSSVGALIRHLTTPKLSCTPPAGGQRHHNNVPNPRTEIL